MKKVEEYYMFSFKANILSSLNKKICQGSSTKPHNTDKLKLRLCFNHMINITENFLMFMVSIKVQSKDLS